MDVPAELFLPLLGPVAVADADIEDLRKLNRESLVANALFFTFLLIARMQIGWKPVWRLVWGGHPERPGGKLTSFRQEVGPPRPIRVGIGGRFPRAEKATIRSHSPQLQAPVTERGDGHLRDRRRHRANFCHEICPGGPVGIWIGCCFPRTEETSIRSYGPQLKATIG